MFLLSTHPYWLIRNLVSETSDISFLFFSFYKYIPQSLDDSRITVKVSREEFLDELFMIHLIDAAPNLHELSMHSNVVLEDGETRHIPMIDMSTPARAHLEKLEPYLDEVLKKQIHWFSSGRSFHGYGCELLSEEKWRRLMGTLLLSNQKEMKPTVDPRWIGHRLIAGFSALRWTRNTDNYWSAPSSLKD